MRLGLRAAVSSPSLSCAFSNPVEPMSQHHSVSVVLDAGYKVRSRTHSHVIVSDEPKDLGGTDLGPNPYELLLTSLGACAAITLRMYAERKGWPLETVQIDLHHEKVYRKDCEACVTEGAENEKLDVIRRDVRIVGDLDDAQRKRLEEMIVRCPVHRTLTSETVIVDAFDHR